MRSLLLLSLATAKAAWGATATGVFIPSSLSYLLPEPYHGYQSIPGNTSTGFVDTTTANASVNALLQRAKESIYYAFDDEFYDILGGETTEISTIEVRDTQFAYEAGAWDYDQNKVWFTSAALQPPTFISVLDMATLNITTLDIPALASTTPNGGYYFNGSVYFAVAGNDSVAKGASGVWAVDTTTYEARPIVNSFYGAPLQSVDDLSWARCRHGPQLFFSTVNFSSFTEVGHAPTLLQDGVYRFDPAQQSVQGVISRADLTAPNGVRSDASGRYLYVTGDAAPFAQEGAAPLPFQPAVITRWTLDADCIPHDKRVLALVRSYADGLHVDDHGRIWTGEWEGIYVRSPTGRVLGVFNSAALTVGEHLPPIANFALAGDKLVILAVNRVYVVQLGQTVSSAAAGTQ